MELARTPIVIAEFKHEIDRPLVSVADLAAKSDDDSDLPDATAPISKAPTSGGSTGRPKLILSGQPPRYVVNPAVLPAWTKKWGMA